MSSPLERPRLKPTIEPIADDGRVILLRGAGDDLELEGDPGDLLALLAALDGTRTLEEVVATLQAHLPDVACADVAEAVDELAACGVLEDAAGDARHLAPAELARYDRQLRYFGDLADLAVPRACAQARLRAATVAVLGLGGLGGMAATMLAACGVGRLVVVDHDVVELSNLARQALYCEADLGRRKVDAATDRLQAINGRCEVVGLARRLDSPAAVASAVADADFVVAAVDWPAAQIGGWVNTACWAAGVPYVSMSQHPPLVRIGPTYVPGSTGCHACQQAEHRERYPLYDVATAAQSADSPAATYAPACGVIGSLVANEAVGFLTGIVPMACRGRAAIIDLRTLTVEHEPVPQRADCAICGTAKALHSCQWDRRANHASSGRRRSSSTSSSGTSRRT